MTQYDYDLFVIGAGSGGVRAANMASGHGVRVAIAEQRYLGGTCVNVGCVPKKLFVYASQFQDQFDAAAGFGWTVGKSYFQLDKLDRQQKSGDRAATCCLQQPAAKIGCQYYHWQGTSA